MKQVHIAAYALGLSAAVSAQAQSGVTIQGVADASVRYVDNEGRGSTTSLASGGNSTSRLIIRGNEDLGSGMSAGFFFEHGFLIDSGTPASSTMYWDRRSTVSLSSSQWGEIRAGRDTVPSYNNWGRYDPFSYIGVGGSANFVSSSAQGPVRAAFGTNPNTLVRSSNAVQWLLPSLWGGLEGGVLVAPKEGGTAANGQHKVAGVRLGYGTKTFNVSGAYTKTENDLTTAGAFKDTALGGHYDFGAVKLSAAWRRFTYADAKQTNVMMGVWVPVFTVGELKASLLKANLAGRVGATALGANDATMLAIGYVHHLSKRSALYTTYARVKNDGASVFSIPGGAGGAVAGGTSSGFEVGFRHSF